MKKVMRFGVAKVTIDFHPKEVMGAVKEASIAPLAKAAFIVEGAAKRSMKAGGRSAGPRGGKVKTPSKAPAPPHVQTGNLRASIHVAKTSYGTMLVGPTYRAWYARLHEFGGRRHDKRPFMRPALIKSKARFAPLFKGLKLANTRAGRLLNSKGASS